MLGRREIGIAAIWDILGRSLGVPVWRLLGGKCRDTMPAYASGGWAPADAIGAVKMRVGAGDGDLMTSVRRVRAARAHLGDGVDIMVDAHGT